jgi:hypothetical protein
MPRQSLKPKQTPVASQPSESESTKENFFQGVDMDSYQQFCQDLIGQKFTNLGLLLNAFTHRSYVNEHKSLTLRITNVSNI